MKTIIKIIVAAIVAMGMACVLIWNDASDNAVIVTYFCVALMVSAILGVFDIKERKDAKHTTIKDAARNYGQAAILVGGACLFLGEPKVCEELCDDLWHRGVQAEVRELSGTEQDFDII